MQFTFIVILIFRANCLYSANSPFSTKCTISAKYTFSTECTCSASRNYADTVRIPIRLVISLKLREMRVTQRAEPRINKHSRIIKKVTWINSLLPNCSYVNQYSLICHLDWTRILFCLTIEANKAKSISKTYKRPSVQTIAP